jgi:hypothetical protein
MVEVKRKWIKTTKTLIETRGWGKKNKETKRKSFFLFLGLTKKKKKKKTKKTHGEKKEKKTLGEETRTFLSANWLVWAHCVLSSYFACHSVVGKNKRAFQSERENASNGGWRLFNPHSKIEQRKIQRFSGAPSGDHWAPSVGFFLQMALGLNDE